MSPRTPVAALGLFFVVCFGCEQAPAVDGRDDTFMSGGKADTGGIAEGSPDANGVLRVANEATLMVLDEEVELDSRAAANIIAYRLGDDETAGTEDDESFGTLAELDAIPFVGKIAFQKLLSYARTHGYVETGSDAGSAGGGDGGTADLCAGVTCAAPGSSCEGYYLQTWKAECDPTTGACVTAAAQKFYCSSGCTGNKCLQKCCCRDSYSPAYNRDWDEYRCEYTYYHYGPKCNYFYTVAQMHCDW